MAWLAWILIAAIIFLGTKLFTYYSACLGLLFYLETEQQCELTRDELKDLIAKTQKRLILDVFKKKSER